MASGRIPDEVIDEVRKRHDIVNVVGKYVHLSRQGKYWKGLCPFHSEKTPSFTVTPEMQIFHCYGCGKSGNVIRFIEEIEGHSFPEAVRVLAEEADIPVTWMQNIPAKGSPQDVEKSTITEAHELAAKIYHYLLSNTKQGQAAKQYLRERGLTDKLIDEYQLGFAPDEWDFLARNMEKRSFDLALLERGGLLSAKQDGSGYVDKFRGRIMLPIWNRDGKVVGFAGRILGDGQPKYLNSPESPLFIKSRLLYNLHRARAEIRKRKQVVLFEGYMDVIKAWSAGVLNGVATMGTSLTEEHVDILRRLTDEVIICYDGDKAGQAAVDKTIPLLEKAGLRAMVALLPAGKDPDDYVMEYGPAAFVGQIIEQSVSATKFKLLYSRNNHILQNEEGRKNYLHEAVRIISLLPSSMEREIHLKELSHEFDISLDALKQDCHALRLKQQNLQSSGDNKDISWNNGRNEKRPAKRDPAILPAYTYAERTLLHVMMKDRDVAEAVHEQIGEAFNVEEYAALAAYLYAYYAGGYDPDAARFMSTLQNEQLEQTAASILLMDGDFPFNEDIMHDYIREIVKVPQLKALDEKKKQMILAERAGNVMEAVQMANEIIALERQLKERLHDHF